MAKQGKAKPEAKAAAEKRPPEEIRLYTLEETTEILHVAYRTLLNYVKDGRLKAKKIGGRWMVTDETLRAFMGA